MIAKQRNLGPKSEAMLPQMTIPHLLSCHPGTAGVQPCRIEARVTRGDASLALNFLLGGDLARLRIPPLAAAVRSERLWQHACFEAFVGVAGAAPYHEFNFSPSGEWAVYAFRAYREPLPSLEGELNPQIRISSTPNNLELDVVIDFDRVSRGYSRATLRIGLSAVIEDKSGALSFWALKHPSDKPDFHHPDSFAFELDPPQAIPHKVRRNEIRD